MKANELMISNWVAQKHGGLLLKVSEVRPPYIIADGEDGQFHEDTLEPIPITPEVLEKNDWEERPTGYVFYTDGKRYDNSLWYIFGSNTFVVNTAEFQIKYVHELQHALRLCGIDKEIVL